MGLSTIRVSGAAGAVPEAWRGGVLKLVSERRQLLQTLKEGTGIFDACCWTLEKFVRIFFIIVIHLSDRYIKTQSVARTGVVFP